MNFNIEHTFQGITTADYEQLYFDEAFQTRLCEAVNLKRTLLRLDRGDARVVRHVKCEPARELPGPIAKALGGKSISYVEELDYDLGKLRGRWKTVPSILPERVETSGTIEFVAVPGGVKRIVTGTIKVSMLGLGGMIEKYVVSDVEKSYGDAAAFTTKWIAEQKKA